MRPRLAIAGKHIILTGKIKNDDAVVATGGHLVNHILILFCRCHLHLPNGKNFTEKD